MYLTPTEVAALEALDEFDVLYLAKYPKACERIRQLMDGATFESGELKKAAQHTQQGRLMLLIHNF